MRHRSRAFVLGSGIGLVLLAGAVVLALTRQAIKLVPSGADEFRLQTLTVSEVRFTFRLPPGQSWNAVYTYLSSQGWIIGDDTLLVWPDLLDDNRTAAVFWRDGWRHLFRERLLIRRDSSEPRRFTAELIKCFWAMSQTGCS